MAKHRITIEIITTDDDNGEAVVEELWNELGDFLQNFDGGDGLMSCRWQLEEAVTEWTHIDGFNLKEVQ